ncbi:MAG: carbohydrate-binding family 9-like protein [Rhodothermales bacterium]|nr:carbohydrate-binding family 9-like protein [Rhodothermales bacterium]
MRQPSPTGFVILLFGLLLASLSACKPSPPAATAAPDAPDAQLTVPSTSDFAVTGDGANPAWERAAWTPLTIRRDSGHGYATRVKMLYSETGLYVLFDGADSLLTATLEGDYLELWTEDVYEFFFWTDERYPVYFEYEISPLGYQLPLIIPNFEDRYFGWIPWQYEGDRVTRKAVSIQGGPATPGAAISGWRAEVFVPYALLTPLQQVPAEKGMRWRANFYRVDYDGGTSSTWSWVPVGESFHTFERYGTLVFE